VTLKMPAFEWVHVQLHQQKGMISLSPPTICNSALLSVFACPEAIVQAHQHRRSQKCPGQFYKEGKKVRPAS
ncbi:hypothetical protein ACRWWD_20465, partial [Escherichia coli]